MIKTIICPINSFTETDNVIRYAAKLSHEFGTNLVLLHMSSFSLSSMLLEGITPLEKSKMIHDTLNNICLDIYKTFHVLCSYEVVSNYNYSEKIIEKARPDALIVMSKRNEPFSSNSIFDSTIYRIIKKGKCPVLIIPKDASYKKIENMIFTWDYHFHNITSFQLLKDFISAFHPLTTFLHISKKSSEISKEVFNISKDEMEAFLGEKHNITYTRIFSDNIPKSLHEYFLKFKTDLAILNFHNRGWIGNIFHGRILKKIIKEATYPILVLQENLRANIEKQEVAVEDDSYTII